MVTFHSMYDTIFKKKLSNFKWHIWYIVVLAISK